MRSLCNPIPLRELLQQLRHPNVVGFVGGSWELDSGGMCLVLELCEKGTLTAVLEAGATLSWAKHKLQMATGVARAMAHLPRWARVHFAPNTEVRDHAGQIYKYANKPLGLMHWLLHASPRPVPGRLPAPSNPEAAGLEAAASSSATRHPLLLSVRCEQLRNRCRCSLGTRRPDRRGKLCHPG